MTPYTGKRRSRSTASEDTGTAAGPLPLFCGRLKRLQQAVGLTQTSLARTAQLSTTQMSDILNGKINTPPDWDVVDIVVRACLDHAASKGKSLAPDLRDEDDKGNKDIWRRRYGDLEQDFEATARPHRGTRAAAERIVETVGQCDPFDLEVHRSMPPVGAASLADGPESLTGYLKREHDKELRAALRRAAVGGPSVFGVLAGDSCTGKTRALYEALREVVADWPLLRPAGAEELLELLQQGRFRAGTVLWLNETQRHLYGTVGERSATLLRSTIAATNGAVAGGALWPRPYLEELTAVGNSPDAHAAARALLDGPRTHRITVPDCLTGQQQQELAALTAGDTRVRAALAASGPEGDVIQHLTGGPELLHAYATGGLFTPVEHALITAALDAHRLGHRGPIPAAFLAEAADGYLSPRQRPGHHDWANSALTGLASGERPDGTRTGIRRALNALKVVRARSGHAESGYEPDDYLDQNGQSARHGKIPPASFWNAAAKYAAPGDLTALAKAATSRGLYRNAAQLYKRATSYGEPEAAEAFLTELDRLDPADKRAASWVAERMPLGNPGEVAVLIDALRECDAEEQITALLGRNPADQIVLDDTYYVAMLLHSLREVGATEQISALLARNPMSQPGSSVPNDPDDLNTILFFLWNAEAYEHVDALYESVANNSEIDSPSTLAKLKRWLRKQGAWEQATALADRAALAKSRPAYRPPKAEPGRATMPADSTALAKSRPAYRPPKAEPGRATMPTDRDELDPHRVALLMNDLREAGAAEQVTALADRAAAHVTLNKLTEVAHLLNVMREAGTLAQVTELADRIAARAPLREAWSVADMLEALKKSDADRQITMLLSRNPAASVHLYNSNAAEVLLKALYAVGAYEQAEVFIERLPGEGMFSLVCMQEGYRERFWYGREVDGRPAKPWGWDDLY